MALGTPVAGAAAYSAAGGTTVSPAYPTGILATDAVLLFVGQKPSTANSGTVTTPAGWTLRGSLTAAGGYGTTLGADTGNTNLRVYSWNTPVAGQTGTLSVTLGTNNVAWAFIVRIPTGGGLLSYLSHTGQQTTTPASRLDVSLGGGDIPNFDTGDMALWAMCIPTDVTTPAQFSAQTLTVNGTTISAAVEINEPDSTTGNDIGGYSAYATVTGPASGAIPSVGVTVAGTLTNVRGPVVLLRVREDAPPARTGSGAATETGADTASGNGDVHVKGSGAAAETGSDTAAATGTVSDQAITGSGAAAEAGSDTSSATGDVIVRGSGAAISTGSDTAASTGDVFVRGTGSATEAGADTAASIGDVFVRGSAALVEAGADTAASTGKVLVNGSGALQEVGSDTAAAAGGNVVTGFGTLVEAGADTASATGAVLVRGAGALVEVGADTAASTGDVLVSGSGAAVETQADTAAGTGGPLVVGSGAAAETGTDTLSSEGLVRVQGTGALQELGADGASAAGQIIVTGIGALQETGSDTASANSFAQIITGVGAANETGADITVGYVTPGYVDDGYVLGVFGFLGPYIAPAGGVSSQPIRPQDYQPRFGRPRKARQQDIVFLGH